MSSIRFTARLAGAVAAAALVAIPTAQALPVDGAKSQASSLIASAPHSPSVERKVKRLRRSAHTPRPQRTITARAAYRILQGCRYWSYNWYRGCVYYETSWNAFIVENQYWNGYKYVTYQSFYCPGAGSGCI
jgi:hypothetical protein